MSEEAALDRLHAAFAEFMTPDESGEPLLLSSDLKHALDAAAIPSQLAPQLLKLMDPDSIGTISFEQFNKVCSEVIGAEAELSGASESEEALSSDAGGFDPEDFDDDEDYEENLTNFSNEVDKEEDESASREASAENRTRDHIFDVMKDKTGFITVASLRREADKLKFNVPRSDLEQMVQMASSKKEFDQIWERLK